MDENNKMDWLKGQTIEIPVEEFVQMRLDMAELKQKEDKLFHRVWDAEEKLKDAQEVIKQYKADIERLLGLEKENEEDNDGKSV